MTSIDSIEKTIAKLLPQVQQFLCELISFQSLSSFEQQAMEFLYEKFGKLNVIVEKVELTDSIKSDPDYSTPILDIKYNGRFNLRICRQGSGDGRRLLLNTHVDVVPSSKGMIDPWIARVEDGIVFGRGACDAKGQVATIYLLCKLLDELDIDLAGDLIAHIVVEEENGGNGSLAMVRRGEKADGCINLEASDGKVLTSIRGAVWFKLTFHGIAGHSGHTGRGRSALLMARDAIGILEKYHDALLQQSRGFALFDAYSDPMGLTFGKLQAGNWPSSAPSIAVLEGVLGFLPNKTKEQVCRQMRQALVDGSDNFNDETFELSFTYRHDCSVVNPKDELPQLILQAGKNCGIDITIGAMTASSDAWFYNNQLGIATVVYGPGTLEAAHSSREQIKMADIGKAATLLALFAMDYCRVH